MVFKYLCALVFWRKVVASALEGLEPSASIAVPHPPPHPPNNALIALGKTITTYIYKCSFFSTLIGKAMVDISLTHTHGKLTTF